MRATQPYDAFVTFTGLSATGKRDTCAARNWMDRPRGFYKSRSVSRCLSRDNNSRPRKESPSSQKDDKRDKIYCRNRGEWVLFDPLVRSFFRISDASRFIVEPRTGDDISRTSALTRVILSYFEIRARRRTRYRRCILATLVFARSFRENIRDGLMHCITGAYWTPLYFIFRARDENCCATLG